MKGIVWRSSNPRKGLDKMADIVAEYIRQDIGIQYFRRFRVNTFQIVFSNNDEWYLLPATEGEARGRRYDLGYVDEDISKDMIDIIRGHTINLIFY